jgi:hypothetical protein
MGEVAYWVAEVAAVVSAKKKGRLAEIERSASPAEQGLKKKGRYTSVIGRWSSDGLEIRPASLNGFRTIRSSAVHAVIFCKMRVAALGA